MTLKLYNRNKIQPAPTKNDVSFISSASFFARSKPKIAPKTGSDSPYMVIFPSFFAGLYHLYGKVHILLAPLQ